MSTKSTLKRELERLTLHTNDSVKGFQKAAEQLQDDNHHLSSHFSKEASARQTHADALNSRLQCIGEDEKERRSLEGTVHHAFISIKDAFTSNDVEAIVDEAIRGEKKLLEYIEDTFEDVEVMDGETHRVIEALKSDVLVSLQGLEARAKAA